MGKKKTRKAPQQAPRPLSAFDGRGGSLALAGVLALAAVLRLWRLDAPVGGFHAFNEANYVLIAQHYFGSSLLLPSLGGHSVFLETPPFYSYLLYAVFQLFGVSVLAARLVTVASSLGSVAATFFLGRRLLGGRPAFVGALFLAVSPVSVLTGRNVQTDSTLLFLLLTALLFWVRAETGNRRDRILSGVFFGLALFTKLFAAVSAVALAVREAIREKGLAFLRDRGRWAAAGIAAILPLAFYSYHAAKNLRLVRRSVLGGAAVATTLPAGLSEWAALGVEALWAFSPLVSLLVLAGVAHALARPSNGRLLLLTQFLAFLLFYLFVHKHSYYFLMLLPFGALLAGDFLERFRPGLHAAGIAVAAVTALFFSLVDITAMKIGFREFAELSSVARSLPLRRIYLIDASFRDDEGTVVTLADPSARLAVLERLPAGPGGKLRLPKNDVYLLRFVPPQAAKPPVGWLFTRERYGLTLFGWTLAEAHANANFFRQGRYFARRTGGPLDFGASVLSVYPALILLPIPPDLALYRTHKGITTGSREPRQNP